MAGPTAHPFLKAFACAGVILIVGSAIMIVAGTGHFLNVASATAVTALYALPFMFISAVVTGALSRWSSRDWPLWQIALGVMFVALVLVIIVFTLLSAIVELPA